MDKDKKIERVAGMLEEASKLLRTPTNAASSTGSEGRPQETGGSSSIRIQESQQRAQNMLRNSSSTGLCRRLKVKRPERLRATSSTSYQQGSKATSVSGNSKKAKKEDKAIEFALLRCWDDDDEEKEPHSLKWDSVIAEGMLILNEDDDEVSVRKKVSFALGNKFPLLGANDFEFVKVKQKSILILELGPGTEYNYPVVKKMAGQGILYMKIKEGYEFVYDGSENVDNNEISGFVQGQKENESPRQEEQNPPVLEPSSVQLQVPLQQAGDTTGIGTGRETPTISEPGQKVQPLEADDFFSTVVNEFPSTIVEPTEMLRYLQKKIVKGRPLDIIDLSAVLEGDVNYITVDRENILETTFEELKNVDDP